MTPSEFSDSLRAYATTCGGSVTSWGRTKERNRRVDGHPESLHMCWLAGDVGYDEPEFPPYFAPDERIKIARRLGMKLVIESDHDHLQAL